jgi:hypothetical protein
VDITVRPKKFISGKRMSPDRQDTHTQNTDLHQERHGVGKVILHKISSKYLAKSWPATIIYLLAKTLLLNFDSSVGSNTRAKYFFLMSFDQKLALSERQARPIEVFM